MKSDFENRLARLAGEADLDLAKRLLKSGGALLGAWRDRDHLLRGVFAPDAPGGGAEVAVVTGEDPQAECSRCGSRFCAHAAALVMYSGRFRVLPPTAGTPPSYGEALRHEELPQLIARAGQRNASLTISVQSAFPHVPTKWENLVLKVSLKGRGREYLGNLNNLRKLYFDKNLGAVLRFDDFSLQERQIIRYLSLYSEADGSNLLLNSEYTAEFFHVLPGFRGIFRDGRRLTVRPERAEAVLVEDRRRLIPAIRIGEAVLPAAEVRVITGRAGCWIGRGTEYFFIAGTCEVGFLRSFFRSQGWLPAPGTPSPFPESFQLPLVHGDPAPAVLAPSSVWLDAHLSDGGEEPLLSVEFSYLYAGSSGTPGRIFAPRSGILDFSGRRAALRDAEWEQRFESAFELYGFDLGGRNAVIAGAEKIGLWLDRVLPELAAGATPLALAPGAAALSRGGAGVPEVEFRCRCLGRAGESYRLSCTFSAAGRAAPWERCSETAKRGGRYFAAGGILMALSPQAGRFFRAAERALRRVADDEWELPLCNVSYFRALAVEIPGALPPELAQGECEVPPEIAADRLAFRGELRAYQQEGVKFMQFMTDRGFNCLLADEMGLGKTVQLLALLASRRRAGTPSLLLCPASLVTNWEREAARFVPALKVAAPKGGERNPLLRRAAEFDLVILSYTAARLSGALLRNTGFDFLVLDEAQHIKNPGSGNTKNCKGLRASHRIVLTGTPLENSPEDLWSVMDFLHPGIFGSLAEFRRTYAGIADDPELRRDLAMRSAPFIKRRTKQEVAADLPPRTETTIFCDFAPEQRKLYDACLEEGRAELARSENGKPAATLFTTLLRLRQICCHPRLLPEGRGDGIPSAKSELLFELLHEHIDSSHRLLLFSQFTSLLHELIPELNGRKIPFEYLDGSTRDRQQRVDRFNRDPSIPLFLLSLKAGGTGLNLTGADTVVIYDPWWNPAVELQAADRSHRIGQSRPVSVIRLAVRDSIEERILALQKRKRRIFDALIAEPGAGGGLTLDEIRELLG